MSKSLIEIAHERFPEGDEYNVIDRTLFYNGGVTAIDLLMKECEDAGIVTKKLREIADNLKAV